MRIFSTTLRLALSLWMSVGITGHIIEAHCCEHEHHVEHVSALQPALESTCCDCGHEACGDCHHHSHSIDDHRIVSTLPKVDTQQLLAVLPAIFAVPQVEAGRVSFSSPPMATGPPPLHTLPSRGPPTA